MIIDPTRLSDSTLVRATETGHACLHFSQLGEDAILWHMFKGKRDGFYIDVGCHHPFRFSNTAIFSNFYNWKGVNIDVDDALIAEFDHARPQDANICAAVGRELGTAEVTFFHEAAVNSLDPDTIAKFKQDFATKSSKTVDVSPLRDILAKIVPDATHVDLLSIDVEGLDFDVLTSHDWSRFVPDIVAIEAHDFDFFNPGENNIFQFLVAKGYRLVAHVVVTSIYTRI